MSHRQGITGRSAGAGETPVAAPAAAVLPSLRALWSPDEGRLANELRWMAIGKQTAALHALERKLDELLSSVDSEERVTAELVEALAALGCRILEATGELSKVIDAGAANGPESGVHSLVRGERVD
jgi:hypothetical protein